jgi:hypothetical protein
VERFNLRNLNSDVVMMMMMDIIRAWESINDNLKDSATDSPGYCELKQYKQWFNEKCSKLLDQRSRINCIGCRIQTK